MREKTSHPGPVRMISSLPAGAAVASLAAALIAGYSVAPAIPRDPQNGPREALTSAYTPPTPIVPPTPIAPRLPAASGNSSQEI